MSGSALRSKPSDSDELLTTRGPVFAAALAAVGFGVAVAVCLLLLLVLSAAATTMLLIWWRARRNGGSRDARYRAVLEQSPNGTVIANAESFAIIDANPAFQQSIGYSLEELRRMTLPQLFTIDRNDPEGLMKLQDPVPRIAVQLSQRCSDGSLHEVEVTGHRLAVDDRAAIAFTVCDVSLRRK